MRKSTAKYLESLHTLLKENLGKTREAFSIRATATALQTCISQGSRTSSKWTHPFLITNSASSSIKNTEWFPKENVGLHTGVKCVYFLQHTWCKDSKKDRVCYRNSLLIKATCGTDHYVACGVLRCRRGCNHKMMTSVNGLRFATC